MSEWLADLSQMLPPPIHPVNSAVDWTLIESQLGFMLPSDYKEYITCFGSGQLSCGLLVYNYSVPEHRERIATDMDILTDIRRGNNDLRVQLSGPSGVTDESILSFSVHPEPGGLLQWGYCQEGWRFYWTTTGATESWGIFVTRDWERICYHFPNISFHSFIRGLFVNPFDEELRCERDFFPLPC